MAFWFVRSTCVCILLTCWFDYIFCMDIYLFSHCYSGLSSGLPCLSVSGCFHCLHVLGCMSHEFAILPSSESLMAFCYSSFIVIDFRKILQQEALICGIKTARRICAQDKWLPPDNRKNNFLRCAMYRWGPSWTKTSVKTSYSLVGDLQYIKGIAVLIHLNPF